MMTDLKINGIGTKMELPQIKSAESEPGTAFDDMMQEAMGKISQVQSDADKAVKELTSGGDPNEAIISMEKADMNFQLMIEVRNKLINAYQTVMNMQV
jgi:flagellar hook-basal body complex protein FliE